MCISFSTRSNDYLTKIIFSKIISIGGTIANTVALYYIGTKSEFIIKFLSYVFMALLSYILVILILRYFIQKESNPDVVKIIERPFYFISVLLFSFSIISENVFLDIPYWITIIYIGYS